MGLLDFNFDDPAMRQGLLSAGAAMMKASGNRRVPVSFIEGLGEGLDQGMQGYYDADSMQRKKMQDDYENQQEMLKRQDQEAQRAALMAYAKSKNKMPQKQAQAAPSVQGFSMPNQQMQNDRVNGNFAGAPMQSSIPQGMPQQNQQAPQMTKGSLVQSQIAELMSQAQFYGSREDYQSQAMAQQLQKQAIELAKELPKYANDFRVAKDKNGNVVNLRMADDGSMMQSDYGVAEKLHFGDNGKQLLGIDNYTGKSQVISDKFQTPDSIASGLVQMRGQDKVNERAKDANDIAKQTNVVNSSTSLRKEFDGLPEVKDYKAAVPAYNSVVDAAKRNSPQSDINLVYGIAKMFDPGSVVREGEYATIASSANIPDRIKGYAQYLAGGGRFTPEVKAALVQEAASRMQSFDQQYKKARTDFETISSNSGANPSLLFPTQYKPTVEASSGKVRRYNPVTGKIE